MALRTSAAKEDPYHDNVRVELLPYDLIFQMCKILSIDTESEMDFKRPVNQSELTGLEAFAFGYDVQWPISLILNRKSLACYQMLLRHLLYCKHVEKLLTRYKMSLKHFLPQKLRFNKPEQAIELHSNPKKKLKNRKFD